MISDRRLVILAALANAITAECLAIRSQQADRYDTEAADRRGLARRIRGELEIELMRDAIEAEPPRRIRAWLRLWRNRWRARRLPPWAVPAPVVQLGHYRARRPKP